MEGGIISPTALASLHGGTMRFSDEERIQRLLNDAKKRELEERFGGSFQSCSEDLPAEIEAQWLNNIDEIERQLAAAGQTSVRNYVGNPRIVGFSDLAHGELKSALNRLLAHLSMHDVYVHFCNPVSDDEAYRFLSEELLNKKIDDVHIAGMTQNFIYEEFHPDDASDARLFAEIFIRVFFSDDPEVLPDLVAQDEPGGAGKKSQLLDRIFAVRNTIPLQVSFSINAIACMLEGHIARVTANVHWETCSMSGRPDVHGERVFSLSLAMDDSGCWPVTDVEIH